MSNDTTAATVIDSTGRFTFSLALAMASTLDANSNPLTLTYGPDLNGRKIRRTNTWASGLLVRQSAWMLVANEIALFGPASGLVGNATGGFTVGVSPTGSIIDGTVIATLSDGGAGGTFSPGMVSLTSASPSASVTYKAAQGGSCLISASNNSTFLNPAPIKFAASI